MPAIDNDDKITLRKANLLDEDYLLELKNDFVVRQNSLDSSVISKDIHKKWYSKVLEDNKTLILIGELIDILRIGYFRFEFKDSKWIISYALNDYARGKNLSYNMLKQALEIFFNEFQEKEVWAVVKKTNLPSLRILIKANFVKVEEDNEKILFVYNKSLG